MPTEPRKYADWHALEEQGRCPECALEHSHAAACRKKLFDRAYDIGFHDGSNRLYRHDHAFVVEMIESGEYEGDGVDEG